MRKNKAFMFMGSKVFIMCLALLLVFGVNIIPSFIGKAEASPPPTNPTTTSVSASPNPATQGQNVTLTATVEYDAEATPTGLIVFSGDQTLVPLLTLPVPLSCSNGSCVATLTVSPSVAGSLAFTATYLGDMNFQGSVGTGSLTVTPNQEPTSTTVGASPNPAMVSQPVTLTATVYYDAEGTPTGTVNFNEGGITLGSGTVTGCDGDSCEAIFTTSSLDAGTHSIVAEYVGDTNFSTSTSTQVTVIVNKFPTTTTVSASPNPAIFGQSVTLTATVSDDTEGTPTGTVDFYEGMTLLGTGTVSGDGVATLSTSSLSVGAHSIIAIYSGDSNFYALLFLSGMVTVNPAPVSNPTDTTVSAAPDTVTIGQSVTLTAAVDYDAEGTPTGTVSFYEGEVLLGTASVTGGAATWSTSTLSVGQHDIIAIYSGDSDFLTSTSTAVTVTVNAAPVTGSDSSPPPPTTSQSVPVSIVTTFGEKSPMENTIFNNLKTAVLTLNGKQIDLPFSGDRKSLQLPNVPAGSYEMRFGIDFGMGYLAYDRGTLTIDADGNATVELIDPYGVITDSFSGKAIEGVYATLHWADTALNHSKGRIPGELVILPILPDFAPNQNKDPQYSNASGQYGWMVFPDGDYYILATKAGYADFDSRNTGYSKDEGQDSYIQNGVIHIGQTIESYDFAMDPIGTHANYVAGYPDGTFGPDRSITRAEVAAVFARITDHYQITVEKSTTSSFADVPSDFWAKDYIEYVYKNGIMIGYEDGSFRPEQLATRAEVATLVAKFKKLSPLKGQLFSDALSNWASGSINAVKNAGIISGYEDGTFRPDQSIKRKEFVIMINRMLGRGPLHDVTQATWTDVPTTDSYFGDIEEASTPHAYIIHQDKMERLR